MSLALLLYKQSLIARKNDLQLQMMNNFDNQRNLLNNVSFMGMNSINAKEDNMNLENISNSIQLSAINAELNSINNAKINYFA